MGQVTNVGHGNPTPFASAALSAGAAPVRVSTAMLHGVAASMFS
jgi:hypothetical protein